MENDLAVAVQKTLESGIFGLDNILIAVINTVEVTETLQKGKMADVLPGLVELQKTIRASIDKGI